MASKYSNITVQGYRRENGRVGVRNHVIILPVDDISNAACEAVAINVKSQTHLTDRIMERLKASQGRPPT